MLLLQALTPMAEAMQRLDSNQQLSHRQLSQQLIDQAELLMEVLQSLQPSASQQIFPRIGPPMQPVTSPSSGN